MDLAFVQIVGFGGFNYFSQVGHTGFIALSCALSDNLRCLGMHFSQFLILYVHLFAS